MFCERGFDVEHNPVKRLENMFVCGAKGTWLGHEMERYPVPNCVGKSCICAIYLYVVGYSLCIFISMLIKVLIVVRVFLFCL